MKVSREENKLVNRPEDMSYEERLRTLVLSSLEKRRLRNDPIALFNFLRRARGEGSAIVFSVTNDRMHGNGTKLGGLDWT